MVKTKEVMARVYSRGVLRHLRPEDTAPFARDGAPQTPQKRALTLHEWMECFLEERVTNVAPEVRRERALEVLLTILELLEGALAMFMRCYSGLFLRPGSKGIYLTEEAAELGQGSGQRPTREECLAHYAAHDRPTALQQLDGFALGDGAEDKIMKPDGEGDAIVGSRTHELMKAADVRVLIPERTTAADAARLLRKIAASLDRGFWID